MNFNIIYTPNTVRPLALFLLSLLDRTSIGLTAVVNGCDKSETDLLEKLLELFSERTELRVFSSGEMHRHPDVLNALQRENEDELFAFMDSDIMAYGNVVPEIDAIMTGNAAFFSGKPVWLKSTTMPAHRDKAAGRFMLDKDGFCLGGTYFAVYVNKAIDEVKEKYGIDLGHYWWKDLDKDVREVLSSQEREYVRYDNAKVLNILLQHLGHPCRYEALDSISHFGGLSRYNTVLSRDAAKMDRHLNAREEQRDMLRMTRYMSEALAYINGKAREPHTKEVKNHFAYEAVQKMIGELKAVKMKFHHELINAGW